MFRDLVASVETLRAIIGEPSEVARKKELPALDPHARVHQAVEDRGPSRDGDWRPGFYARRLREKTPLLGDRDGQPRPRAHRDLHVGIDCYQGDLPGRMSGHYREVASRLALDASASGASIA